MKDFFWELDTKNAQYKRKYLKNQNRAAAHAALWAFKSIFKKWNNRESNGHKTNNVLFALRGGIGDIILGLNYLKQLIKRVDSGLVFDVVVMPDFIDAVRILLAGQDFVNDISVSKLRKKYVLECSLCRMPILENYNREYISKNFKKLAVWVDIISNFGRQNSEYLSPGSVSDYLLTNYTMRDGRNRISMADIGGFVGCKSDLHIKTLSDADVLRNFNLVSGKYITIQSGVGLRSGGKNGVSTREWPLEYYNELIAKLKNKYPDIKIVQIGNAFDLQMDSDVDLRGKSTFGEFLAILKNAMLHIGGESGPVHMRHFMGARPSVVLFGPTNADFYGYPENINISSDVCPGCEWLHRDWSSVCIKTGNIQCAALKKIRPDFVLKQIDSVIKG